MPNNTEEEDQTLPPLNEGLPPAQAISNQKQRTAIIGGLSVLVLFFVGVVLLWKWVQRSPVENNTHAPLTAVQQKLNTATAQFLFDSTRLVPTYAVSEAVPSPRVNGNYGMTPVDLATYRLAVKQPTGDTLFVTMDDIKALPKQDIVYDFKCIEGWSQKTHWGGCRFIDFMERYNLGNAPAKKARYEYASLVTPDGDYFVGIDMPSMVHPQTILAYEMNGQPLPENQGAPLRLIIPVKYGIKSLKRIGTIGFSNTRPRDYWHEKGYDYYSGH